MVCVDAALAVVAVLFGRTPRRLIHEHIEHESILIQVQILEVEVQVETRKQTLRHEVVLDTLVLEVQVNFGDLPQIPQFKTGHFIRLSALVECDNQRPIKPVVAEEFELLSVVVPCQSLFI